MTQISGVTLEIGGTERVLRLTKQARYRLETETPWGLVETVKKLGGANMAAAAHLVWAGRLHAEPRLTVSDVVEEIEYDDLKGLIKPLMAMLNDAGIATKTKEEAEAEKEEEEGLSPSEVAELEEERAGNG